MMGIEVESIEEFEKLLTDYDGSFPYEFSLNLVNTILDNLDTSKRFLNVLEVYIEEEGQILDITVDRDDFISTLERNLSTLEHYEDFEKCIEVQKAMEGLKSLRDNLDSQK